MLSFDEFLKAPISKLSIEAPPSVNSLLITEGIIFPLNVKLSDDDIDVNTLNNMSKFRDMNILFGYDIFPDGGGAYRDGKILIDIKGVRTARELINLIRHEIIHAIQDERSQGKFNSWKSVDIFHKNPNKIFFNNPYERMAYAFQFVTNYKDHIENGSFEDMYYKILKAYPEFKNDKQFKTYLGRYYTEIA